MAKLQKPPCVFVPVEQISYHWTDLYEILYLSILLKFVEKILVSLKSDKE